MLINYLPSTSQSQTKDTRSIFAQWQSCIVWTPNKQVQLSVWAFIPMTLKSAQGLLVWMGKPGIGSNHANSERCQSDGEQGSCAIWWGLWQGWLRKHWPLQTPTISLVQDEKCMNIADHAKNTPFQNCQKQLHSLGTGDTVYTKIALFLSLIFLQLKQ